MAISPCDTIIDQYGREIGGRGTVDFPVSCYHDDLRSDFVPWHWHEEMEAVVVEKGRTILGVGSQRFELEEGEGFFINANALHACWGVEGTSCFYHSLVFDPRLVGGSLDSAIWQKYVQPLLDHPEMEVVIFRREEQESSSGMSPVERTSSEKALQCIERAWQACAMESPGYELTVRESLSWLMYSLPVPRAEKQSGTQQRTAEEERMKKMLEYIHVHFGEQITLGEIAGSASVSESACLRCFRRTLGMSPVQYLIEYRLQKAAALLREGSEPVSGIAHNCGFSDFSYFSRKFRSRYKTTPSEYRALLLS